MFNPSGFWKDLLKFFLNFWYYSAWFVKQNGPVARGPGIQGEDIFLHKMMNSIKKLKIQIMGFPIDKITIIKYRSQRTSNCQFSNSKSSWSSAFRKAGFITKKAPGTHKEHKGLSELVWIVVTWVVWFGSYLFFIPIAFRIEIWYFNKGKHTSPRLL